MLVLPHFADMIEVKRVTAHWDAEAGVWWADSDDIPGLVTEAPTFEALIARAGAVIPDLLDELGIDQAPLMVEYRSDTTGSVELIGRQRLRAELTV